MHDEQGVPFIERALVNDDEEGGLSLLGTKPGSSTQYCSSRSKSEEGEIAMFGPPDTPPPTLLPVGTISTSPRHWVELDFS